MSGGDLIVAVPWLVFAAAMAVIGWRLAAGRRMRREHRPGPPGKGADRPGTGAADRESAD
jgi:hypothetical protein